MKRCLIVFLCLSFAAAASAQDAIDLSAAVVHNSPADVASWARTTRITRLTMQPEGSRAPGLSVDFAARATWPDYTPPGFEGPIQYTFWAGVRISGVWHVSGIIRMWRDRAATGAPILTNNNFAVNWVYDSRWGAMGGYQPVAGEAMIFFVTAGNARGVSTVTSVRERSNVVMVNLPANDTAVFDFAAQQTDLLIDFGAQGLWALTDAAAYTLVHPANPKTVAAGNLDGAGSDEVIVDFGDGLGIWVRWNGAAWAPLHSLSASSIVTGDLDNNGRLEVILDFPGAGTYIFANGTTWQKLHALNPSKMFIVDIDGGGKDVVLDFPGAGLWLLRNGTTWIHLHGRNATAIAAGDFDGNGASDLAVAFPGNGVALLMNGTGWVSLHGQDVVHLAAGNIDANRASDLILDFGEGGGIWMLRNGSLWSQVHATGSRQITVADLDGNGTDDIAVNFGPVYGVWVWANNREWRHAHASSPDQMVTAFLN